MESKIFNKINIMKKTIARLKKTISSAILVVTDLANQYEYKQDSTWFEYSTKEDYTRSFEEDQGTYCEDCIDERETDILINEDNSITFPDDFENLIQSVETSKEHDGFLHCDSCGEIIECGILWSPQDFEHWTDLDGENWKKCKNNSKHYYQIYTILKECGEESEYASECLIIAEKVLKYW